MSDVVYLLDTNAAVALLNGDSAINALLRDAETARWYGRIYQPLRAIGRPIPQNDVWIAAVALQHNLTLLTRDVHFNEVDNLPLASW